MSFTTRQKAGTKNDVLYWWSASAQTTCFCIIFLVTSLDNIEWHGRDALDFYRKRGKAEGHMGELKGTLNVHQSSTCRGASTVQNVMGRNQVNLLLDLYAYQLMHSLRVLMEYITH